MNAVGKGVTTYWVENSNNYYDVAKNQQYVTGMVDKGRQTLGMKYAWRRNGSHPSATKKKKYNSLYTILCVGMADGPNVSMTCEPSDS